MRTGDVQCHLTFLETARMETLEKKKVTRKATTVRVEECEKCDRETEIQNILNSP